MTKINFDKYTHMYVNSLTFFIQTIYKYRQLEAEKTFWPFHQNIFISFSLQLSLKVEKS